MTILVAALALSAAPKRVQLATGDTAPPIPESRDVVTGVLFDWKASLERVNVLVVSFVDPFAGETAADLNQLDKIESEWRPAGVEIVSIGRRQRAEELTALRQKFVFRWPLLADPQGEISRAWGASTAPYVVIVSKDGKVAHIAGEMSRTRYENIRVALEKLTSRPAPWGRGAGQRHSALLGQPTKWIFGHPPSDPGAAIRWQPLAMVLGRAANAYVSMSAATTYEEYEDKLRRGDYQLADAGIVAAHGALAKYEPLVTFERRGSSTYRGVFFALRSSGISDLGALRGKTIAMVSERSTSGGVFPFAKLVQAGVEPEHSVRILWVGSHPAVAEAVKVGRADAGACYEDCRDTAWPLAADRDRQTVFLGYTDDIPCEVILARRDLPEHTRQELRRALLSTDGAAVLQQISFGETPVSGVSAANEERLIAAGKLLEGVADKMLASRRAAEASQRWPEATRPARP